MEGLLRKIIQNITNKMEGDMRVIVGCEFSQIVTKEFRKRGHDAYSCDLLATEGNPEWHFQENILKLLERESFDLGIFHPPCTYLAVSGARWFKDRQKEQNEALTFVRQLLAVKINKIALENPISVISTRIRKPDQIVQPWMFGHGETKATCLWLKNLPLLKPTKIVAGRKNRIHKMPPSKDRSKLRSITFSGIAEAMATQWR